MSEKIPANLHQKEGDGREDFSKKKVQTRVLNEWILGNYGGMEKESEGIKKGNEKGKLVPLESKFPKELEFKIHRREKVSDLPFLQDLFLLNWRKVMSNRKN
ncbi:hypothetical protein CH361_08790 [Leptospira brenneri]|nr:hypothetical protein CH361_08790 [Leptospira brenneri]